MTGIVAVDIAIGLIFVFLLYSLLASILQEIIATFLGLRARNLKKAIGRMLQDEEKNSKTKAQTLGKALTKKMSLSDFDKKHTLLKAFYDQPVIKYLASGKLFSKPSYIGGKDFSTALIKILKKHESEIKDVDKRIEEAIQKSELIDEETRAHLMALWENAEKNVEKFKLSLEGWFDSTMERAAGWYKRSTQLSLLIIGFVIAAVFHVSTLEIVNVLSNDQAIRGEMVQLAVSATESQDFKATIDKLRNKDSVELDSLGLDQIESRLDSLFGVYGTLKLEAEKANHVMGYSVPDSLGIIGEKIKTNELDSITKTLTPDERIIGDYRVRFSNIFLAKETSKFYQIKNANKDKKDKQPAYYASLNRWNFFWHHIWGYLITALAISLGAPFWFDLLSKLVKVRTSIQKIAGGGQAQQNPQTGQR